MTVLRGPNANPNPNQLDNFIII